MMFSARLLGRGAPRLIQSRGLSSGSIRLGKNKRETPPAQTPQANASQPVPQQETPPPVYYDPNQQMQRPVSFGQSLVIYSLLGFGITFGIAMVRMVFSEGKTNDEDGTDAIE